MDWEILYYSDEVQETIGAWPVGTRAYYARITERMCAFGPNLGMPFTDSLGVGFSKFERGARKASGALSSARWWSAKSSSFTPTSRNHRRYQQGNWKSPANAWPRYKDGVKNGSDEDTR